MVLVLLVDGRVGVPSRDSWAEMYPEPGVLIEDTRRL
jgi:hypothetical protein